MHLFFFGQKSCERIFKKKRYEEIFIFCNDKSRGENPCFNCSTYWDLLSKYDKKCGCNEDNNANYELYYTNSFCVILILSPSLIICAKTIDERVFLLEEDEIPKQSKSNTYDNQNYF